MQLLLCSLPIVNNDFNSCKLVVSKSLIHFSNLLMVISMLLISSIKHLNIEMVLRLCAGQVRTTSQEGLSSDLS